MAPINTTKNTPNDSSPVGSLVAGLSSIFLEDWPGCQSEVPPASPRPGFVAAVGVPNNDPANTPWIRNCQDQAQEQENTLDSVDQRWNPLPSPYHHGGIGGFHDLGVNATMVEVRQTLVHLWYAIKQMYPLTFQDQWNSMDYDMMLDKMEFFLGCRSDGDILNRVKLCVGRFRLTMPYHLCLRVFRMRPFIGKAEPTLKAFAQQISKPAQALSACHQMLGIIEAKLGIMATLSTLDIENIESRVLKCESRLYKPSIFMLVKRDTPGLKNLSQLIEVINQRLTHVRGPDILPSTENELQLFIAEASYLSRCYEPLIMELVQSQEVCQQLLDMMPTEFQ